METFYEEGILGWWQDPYEGKEPDEGDWPHGLYLLQLDPFVKQSDFFIDCYGEYPKLFFDEEVVLELPGWEFLI